MLTNNDRKRLRQKQDRVCEIHKHCRTDLRISSDGTAPDMTDLEGYLYPEWEWRMDEILNK